VVLAIMSSLSILIRIYFDQIVRRANQAEKTTLLVGDGSRTGEK